ncbi:MAG: hypothetical protein H6P96_1113 [Candidatus Aminicenantes bacterium]|nr:hypothetical protein [Candidatus Aminicenantes bacterium]
MRDSQETELKEVQRKAEDEKAKIQNPVAKKKVDEQAATRIGELKRKHDQEKADLEKRQNEEKEKAKKVPVRKKVDRN